VPWGQLSFKKNEYQGFPWG